MVSFEYSNSTEEKVIVNGKHFGYVSKEHGFFTDSTVIRDFTQLSAEDLDRIAQKVREARTPATTG